MTSSNCPYYLAPIGWYRECLTGVPYTAIAPNSCLINTRSGVQRLTIPLVGGSHAKRLPLQDIRISDHGNWRHLHWQALQTAYGRTPFWEYYQDDFAPFFHDQRWERLADFNTAIHQVVMSLLDFAPEGVVTYPQNITPLPAEEYHLSIIDLLCRKGNEAVAYLI